VTEFWTRFLDLLDLQDHSESFNPLIVSRLIYSNIGIVIEEGGDRILSVDICRFEKTVSH